MRVRVLFFGMLKELMGRSSDQVSLPAGATVADLVALCESQAPRLGEWRRSLALSVNQQYARPETVLGEDDEVAFLPPVSGGKESKAAAREQHRGPDVSSGEAERSSAGFCTLVRERIRPHDIVPPRERPEDGAVVVFDGIVRNHSRGRRTLYLEYEAYEEMALKQMRALAAEALERFAVRDVALVHRVGRLEIGESSVFIAVFAAHRAPAFDACRWLIDRLKRTVPIWKKEFFQDGAVWADGEPFPEELRQGEVIPPARASS